MNHVSIALGSHGELSTLIELAGRLKFIDGDQCLQLEHLNERVGRLLYGLHRALAARRAPNP